MCSLYLRRFLYQKGGNKNKWMSPLFMKDKQINIIVDETLLELTGI